MPHLRPSGLAVGCALTLIALTGCGGRGSDTADRQPVEEPSATVATVPDSPSATTATGPVVVDLSYGDTIEAAFAQVEAFWAGLHGFTVSDRPVRCGDAVVEPDLIIGTGYYCPADNTVEIDADAERATFDEAGDAAATYRLLHAYTQAVITQTTDVIDPRAAVLAADCLAGVWERDTFDDLKAYEDDADYEPTHLLWFSAGDLDEILVGITLTPPLAPGAVDPGPIGPFDRTNAFGDGFFDGPGACTTN